MICEMYSVKDELNQTFHQPIFLQSSQTSEDEAKRIFISQVNNTPVWKDNPQDFTLYYMGAFDINSGTFAGEKKEIINGKSVRKEL